MPRDTGDYLGDEQAMAGDEAGRLLGPAMGKPQRNCLPGIVAEGFCQREKRPGVRSLAGSQAAQEVG